MASYYSSTVITVFFFFFCERRQSVTIKIFLKSFVLTTIYRFVIEHGRDRKFIIFHCTYNMQSMPLRTIIHKLEKSKINVNSRPIDPLASRRGRGQYGKIPTWISNASVEYIAFENK